MNTIHLYDKVIIKETGKIAFVVWIREPEQDSFLLEIKGKNEMPLFYEPADFEKIYD